jgi:hypothetical protein
MEWTLLDESIADDAFVSPSETHTVPILRMSPFLLDSRGNRLHRYEVRQLRGTEERRIYLFGPAAVATQVEWVLQNQGCRSLELEDQQRREWTHRYRVDGPVSSDVRGMLDLLKEVLTLEAPTPINTALALDFYKDPDSNEDPMQWANTRAGNLVNLGKYQGSVRANKQLTGLLVDVIDRHPIFRAADLVISVPGSNSAVVGFGQQLATAVARDAGKTLVPARARSAVRPAAKNRDQGQIMDLTEEFIVGPEANGRVAIVVDDVYRSGGTMRAVALAARRAGAVGVLGLVGARTMRGGK